MKFLKEIWPYIAILAVVILVRTFIITPVMVDGTSMVDTLKDNQILLLKKYDQSYERFDIVVFDYNDEKLVKRVIGLPGEHVKYENGTLYINDQPIEDKFSSITRDFDLAQLDYEVIPEGFYFVLGDNRKHSSDSRVIGLIDEKKIQGTTSFSLWPFKSIR